MKRQKKEKDAAGTGMAEAVKKIRARFGPEAIVMLDEKPRTDIDAIPTGSIGLDWALGIGGYPRGRIVEIFGPESSGKTTVALHAIAQAQAMGLQCAFIDAEHAMDPQYAKKLGVDTSKLPISQPSNGEEAMQIVDALVRGGDMGLIVVDSVAALTPKAEIEGEIGDTHVGRLARLMSQSLRVLGASVSKSKAVVIFINQVRANLAAAATWGAPAETTTGGKALKFYASVRLEVRRIGSLKDHDVVVGARSRAKVLKNKVAVPFRQAEFDIMFNRGINREGEVVDWGQRVGVVEHGAATVSWGDNKLGRGRDAACEKLRAEPELRAQIEAEVKAKMAETQ